MSALELPLSTWPIGSPAVLVTARGRAFGTAGGSGADLAMLLSRLGLRVGMRVTPLQHTPGRGLVLAVGDLRLALDRRTAESLFVHAPGHPSRSEV